MRNTALALEKILIEGKVFKGGATWGILEKFFEKQREKILEDLSCAASPAEIDCLKEQIESNEYYEDNVRVVDPDYLDNKDNISALFALNSKLCSVQGVENLAAARELMELKYLLIYSPEKNNLATKMFENDPELTEKERKLFTAYDYYNARGKKVLLLSPDMNLHKRARERGLDAITLDGIS